MNTRSAHPLVAHLISVVVFCVSVAAVQMAVAQESVEPATDTQSGRYGIGFASSWPAYGISGTMQVSETITAEAVMGFFGSVSNFGGRGWYRFNRNPNYDLYGYASASVYRYRYTEFVGPTFSARRATENVLGLGGGVGIEAGIQSLFKDETLPPVFLNWEIGLALANFDYYNFSSFSFGGGIHYRFGK